MEASEPPRVEAGADDTGATPEEEESADDGEADDAESADGDSAEEEASAADRVAALENEGDIAADYLEDLLDIADLDGDLDIEVEGERAAVSIIGADLSDLVGPDGRTLEALQELTRLAVLRQTGERSRLMLDVGGYRAARRAELEKVGAEAAAEVRDTGEPKKLASMTPFERKVVHDAVAAAGLRSESEGEEPNRRVVVLPAQP
ncbi:MAG: single-stranded DNA-binding protein [Propionibacteriales bacterium]|nr:single-stranded DNA-binding protein [Propionibacteriales bacterium]